MYFDVKKTRTNLKSRTKQPRVLFSFEMQLWLVLKWYLIIAYGKILINFWHSKVLFFIDWIFGTEIFPFADVMLIFSRPKQQNEQTNMCITFSIDYCFTLQYRRQWLLSMFITQRLSNICVVNLVTVVNWPIVGKFSN